MSINVPAVSRQNYKPTMLTPKSVWITLLFKKAFAYLAEAWT